ncbi:MAG: 50S ribosomal protein L18 [Patescibacteria group bacterium]|nr:50S ribosomal protein L18 [Patescibacteria group bacterium]
MHKTIKQSIARSRRHARIRARAIGSSARPRLSVFKSNRYMVAQLIDDAKGATLLSGSTMGLKGTKTESARALGETLGKALKEQGIKAVVFDRGGFRYTGRVAAVADGVRTQGIDF